MHQRNQILSESEGDGKQNPLIAQLRELLFFLIDGAKNQVEQVWMTPSYDMNNTGMCGGVIKQNNRTTPEAPPGELTLWEEKRRNESKVPKPTAPSSFWSIPATG